MKNAARTRFFQILCFSGFCFTTGHAFAQSSPSATGVAATTSVSAATAARRDGSHDFDFNIGSWVTHIRRLQTPLSGSHIWLDYTGTVVVRKVWNGRASLEEIEADGPAKDHFEGMTLFLYNPHAHQWSQSFSSSDDGTLEQPVVGEFRNGRGEFYDQEAYQGRMILVRVVWSDITPNSHTFEQSFSDDGGKTWEPNFVAHLTRKN